MAVQQPDRTLGDYLVALVISSDLRDRFEADPKGTLETSGLKDAKQKILASGDLKQILDEVASEFGIAPGDHHGA